MNLYGPPSVGRPSSETWGFDIRGGGAHGGTPYRDLGLARFVLGRFDLSKERFGS